MILREQKEFRNMFLLEWLNDKFIISFFLISNNDIHSRTLPYVKKNIRQREKYKGKRKRRRNNEKKRFPILSMLTFETIGNLSWYQNRWS